MNEVESGKRLDYLGKLKRDYRRNISSVFDGLPNSQERIRFLLVKINPLLKELSSSLDRATIEKEVRDCHNIEDRTLFIDQIIVALTPILDLAAQDPVAFESHERNVFMESADLIKINEIICYEINDQGWLDIHLAACRTMTPDQRKGYFSDAFRKFQKLARDDKNIKGITGTSTLVTRMPELFTSFGFIIDGPVDAERSSMHLDREDLLNNNYE